MLQSYQDIEIGPVEQPGVFATLSLWRSPVQIRSGPPIIYLKVRRKILAHRYISHKIYLDMKLDNKTILVIEDDALLARNLDVTLRQSGARVIVASDGMDGLAKLGEEKPDLILLDIMMPKMNGYEMLKQIKENPETKIFLSLSSVTLPIIPKRWRE